MRIISVLLLSLLSCASPPKTNFTVAAAANLTEALEAIGKAFTDETGIPITYSFGATANLAAQIERGAPFDVFLAADCEHVDSLVQANRIAPETRHIYARGQLAVWAPETTGIALPSLATLTDPRIRFIAIANPATAPYGAASVEALRKSRLWDHVQRKVVYAASVSMAKQFAATGNAEAAFTAYSLLHDAKGQVLRVEESLHSPLDQALGIVTGANHRAAAKRFVDFVLSPSGAAILTRYGYLPPQKRAL